MQHCWVSGAFESKRTAVAGVLSCIDPKLPSSIKATRWTIGASVLCCIDPSNNEGMRWTQEAQRQQHNTRRPNKDATAGS
eukprot:1147416-Pelagomonas_calceolata.AAC.6